MTWTAEDDHAARDRGRTSGPGRTGRLRRTLLGALVGAVLLGLAGAAWAATRSEPVSAAALVLSSPDPTAVETASGGSTSGDPSARNATYLETELVYLRGADLAERVAATTGDRAPDLDATRVGDSNVVQIQATADRQDTAVRDAQAAADLYVADRQARLTQRIAAQTQAVEEQIAGTNATLLALGEPEENGFDADARQREALSALLSDQLGARDALQRAAADVTQVATPVEAAEVLPGGALSSGVLALIGGAVLGALLGAVLPGLVGSLRGRVQDEGDVAALGAPLLSPALPWSTDSRHTPELARAVQLQALALPDGPVSGGSVAFLAPTAGVGSTFTAVQHARHAARRRNVLLVLAGGAGSDVIADLDLDPRHAGLAELGQLATPEDPLTGDALGTVVQPTRIAGLSVLTPGAGHEDDVAAMERALASGVLPAAVSAGWAVVVDAAPLDHSDAGLQAARQCTETVLVTAARVSSLDDVERTLDVLRSAGVAVSGVIVNRPPRRRHPRPAVPRTDDDPTAPPPEGATSEGATSGATASGPTTPAAESGPPADASPADEATGDGPRAHVGRS